MPRILFCTQSAYPVGGVESWLECVADALQARGWDCTVALAQGRCFHRPELYRAAHLRLETVEVDGRLGTPSARVRALVRVIRRLQPDVVVPVGLYEPLVAAARRKAAGQSILLVPCLHTLAGRVFADLRAFRPFIDLAVCVNRLQVQMLRNWVRLPESRCLHVPVGIRRVPGAGAVINRASGEPLRLAYVGRLDQEEKRILDVIPFCQELRQQGTNYRLTLAGDGPCAGALRSALQAEIATGQVRLTGWLSPERLHETIYRQHDLLLLFSPSETGPIVAWEAMAEGMVPVVADFRGRAAEGIIRHGETGLVFPVRDSAAAARCVRDLAADAALIDRLSWQAREAVAGRTDPEMNQAAWVRAFEEAVQRPPVPIEGAPIPAPALAGRLEQWGLPAAWADGLRWLLRRVPRHQDSGGEWPHCGPCTAEIAADAERSLCRFDQESALATNGAVAEGLA